MSNSNGTANLTSGRNVKPDEKARKMMETLYERDPLRKVMFLEDPILKLYIIGETLEQDIQICLNSLKTKEEKLQWASNYIANELKGMMMMIHDWERVLSGDNCEEKLSIQNAFSFIAFIMSFMDLLPPPEIQYSSSEIELLNNAGINNNQTGGARGRRRERGSDVIGAMGTMAVGLEQQRGRIGRERLRQETMTFESKIKSAIKMTKGGITGGALFAALVLGARSAQHIIPEASAQTQIVANTGLNLAHRASMAIVTGGGYFFENPLSNPTMPQFVLEALLQHGTSIAIVPEKPLNMNNENLKNAVNAYSAILGEAQPYQGSVVVDQPGRTIKTETTRIKAARGIAIAGIKSNPHFTTGLDASVTAAKTAETQAKGKLGSYVSWFNSDENTEAARQATLKREGLERIQSLRNSGNILEITSSEDIQYLDQPAKDFINSLNSESILNRETTLQRNVATAINTLGTMIEVGETSISIQPFFTFLDTQATTFFGSINPEGGDAISQVAAVKYYDAVLPLITAMEAHITTKLDAADSIVKANSAEADLDAESLAWDILIGEITGRAEVCSAPAQKVKESCLGWRDPSQVEDMRAGIRWARAYSNLHPPVNPKIMMKAMDRAVIARQPRLNGYAFDNMRFAHIVRTNPSLWDRMGYFFIGGAGVVLILQVIAMTLGLPYNYVKAAYLNSKVSVIAAEGNIEVARINHEAQLTLAEARLQAIADYAAGNTPAQPALLEGIPGFLQPTGAQRPRLANRGNTETNSSESNSNNNNNGPAGPARGGLAGRLANVPTSTLVEHARRRAQRQGRTFADAANADGNVANTVDRVAAMMMMQMMRGMQRNMQSNMPQNNTRRGRAPAQQQLLGAAPRASDAAAPTSSTESGNGNGNGGSGGSGGRRRVRRAKTSKKHKGFKKHKGTRRH